MITESKSKWKFNNLFLLKLLAFINYFQILEIQKNNCLVLIFDRASLHQIKL